MKKRHIDEDVVSLTHFIMIFERGLRQESLLESASVLRKLATGRKGRIVYRTSHKT